MTALSRRTALLAAAAAVVAWPVPAKEGAWVEVVGYARASGPADVEAARRRALADALLAAALAGGAEVRGHSVLSQARLTSDLLVVRPVGRVLAHQVVSADFDGQAWTVRLRARVGAGAGAGAWAAGACGARRRLTVSAAAPSVRVAAAAPAWTAPVADMLAERLLRAAAAHPGVAGLQRLARPPAGAVNRDGERYLTLTRGPVLVPDGDHILAIGIEVVPAGRGVAMTVGVRLDGPMGESFLGRHAAAVREPGGASPLGRTAVLVTAPRPARAEALVRGAVGVLEDVLDRATCRDIAAPVTLAGGRLVVAVGREHGLTSTSLAFTPDAAAGSDLLEITELGPRRAVLRPLDPQRPPAAFAGRIVRFVLTGQALP